MANSNDTELARDQEEDPNDKWTTDSSTLKVDSFSALKGLTTFVSANAVVGNDLSKELNLALGQFVSSLEPSHIDLDSMLQVSSKEKPKRSPVVTPDQEGLTRSKEMVFQWPSLLMRLMNENDDDEWESVYQRILSNPEEIKLRGLNGGQNAIHAACVRYPPVRIIEAALEYDADSAMVQNFSGETPLHVASFGCSEEVQCVLLACRPAAAALADQYGDLPLHFAARNGATISLMEEMLRAYPEGISVTNKRGVTPFWLLPRSYLAAETMEEVLEDDSEEDTYLDDWNLLVLYLRYSYFGQDAMSISQAEIDDYEKWIVHAAVATPSCPREVLKFLCRMFPNSALRYDRKGYTPLLLAAQGSDLSEPSAWDENEDGFREPVDVSDGELSDGTDGGLSMETTALQGGDSAFLAQAVQSASIVEGDDEETVIDILLEWCPRAIVHVDRQGRLPLAHALVSGKDWKAVRRLIAACPRAIECRDRVTGFHMFQLATLHVSSIDSVFTLVRSMPELAQPAAASRSRTPLYADETLQSEAKRPRLC